MTTGATSSSTVTLRKNSANATNTFSINANTTGAFSDTTPHNDSIATGDLIAVEVVAGSSALIIDIIACTFQRVHHQIRSLVLVVWKSQMHLVVRLHGTCQAV